MVFVCCNALYQFALIWKLVALKQQNKQDKGFFYSRLDNIKEYCYLFVNIFVPSIPSTIYCMFESVTISCLMA